MLLMPLGRMAIVLIFWRRSHPVFCLSLINPVHEMTIARWHFTASFVIHMTVSFTLRSRVIVDSMKLLKINGVPTTALEAPPR